MFRSENSIRLMCTAALTVGAAIIANLLVVQFGGMMSPLLRNSVALGCGLLAAVGAAVGTSRVFGHQHQVERYVEMLCRLSAHDLTNMDAVAASLPVVAPDHAWSKPLHNIRERLQQLAGEVEVSDQQKTRTEIRAQRAQHERQQMTDILAGLTDAVLAVDHFGEVVLANAAAEQLFGFTLATADDKSLEKLVASPALVAILAETRRRKSSSQRTNELFLADRTGQQHWHSVSCRTLAGGEGAGGQGAVAVLRDISHLKAVQKRHAEFVASVSHEMKTPLAGIKAYVELLADGAAEQQETRDEFLEVINSQAERLRRLIDNLLNLARIEAGVVQVQKSPRSLNEVMEEAVSVVKHAATDKHITLAAELSPMYLGVLADRDMLLQAAINLLSNAIKYTPNGGRVTLRTRMADDAVEFSVEDTGVGLSPEDQVKVFEKFYRVKKNSEMAPGTGLGLPLAKHIVEDVHGGRLTVDSELNKGSTFRVSLPPTHQRTESREHQQPAHEAVAS